MYILILRVFYKCTVGGRLVRTKENFFSEGTIPVVHGAFLFFPEIFPKQRDICDFFRRAVSHSIFVDSKCFSISYTWQKGKKYVTFFRIIIGESQVYCRDLCLQAVFFQIATTKGSHFRQFYGEMFFWETMVGVRKKCEKNMKNRHLSRYYFYANGERSEPKAS